MRFKKIAILALFAVILAGLSIKAAHFSSASNVQELQDKISQKNQEIAQIQKEIEVFENEISKASTEAASLKNQISKLQATAQKLKAEIRLTEASINSAGFALEKLGMDIETTSSQIGVRKQALAEIIRKMDEEESQTLIEILLAHANISEFFDDLENMKVLQKDVDTNMAELRNLKEDLEDQQKQKEEEKTNLEDLHNKLDDQKKIAESNQNQKNALLTQTKSKETTYKKLLADRMEKQKQLENEINSYEDQLRMEIDPDSLPHAGSGVLAWPLDKVYITQYFGNTPFATQNPQVYNEGGHKGIDFRASIGTAIKSSGSGKVIGTGDTDKQCAGVSYGKWVLIQHPNNLSTLYAHLSLVKVTSGQSVSSGEIIGYSGDTGYATGPHLHYSVFAASAVSVGTIKSKICGTNMTLPVAPSNGYLNPLSYL